MKLYSLYIYMISYIYIWYHIYIYDIIWYIWFDNIYIYDMILYDMIWYDIYIYDIWYDMIWYYIYIYLIWCDMIWYDIYIYIISYIIYRVCVLFISYIPFFEGPAVKRTARHFPIWMEQMIHVVNQYQVQTDILWMEEILHHQKISRICGELWFMIVFYRMIDMIVETF